MVIASAFVDAEVEKLAARDRTRFAKLLDRLREAGDGFVRRIMPYIEHLKAAERFAVADEKFAIQFSELVDRLPVMTFIPPRE